jgi:hypothetical protein
MKKLLLFLCLHSCFVLIAQNDIIWNAPVDVASMSMYGNDHPRITLDGSGNPMIIWGNPSNDNAYFSKWNGAAFTTPMIVNSTFPVFAATWAGPDIASKGDTVYVVVKETPEDSNPGYIYTSFDGGNSFSAPVQFDGFISDSVSRFPTVTTDATGNPIVAFMELNPDFSNARWVTTRSNDFGATFTPDILASDWSGGDVCDCCPGGMAISGNNLAVMYRDNDANIRDSWTGISTDGGASFDGGFALETPNWMLMSCPSSGPDGVIIGDSLYSVFMNGYSGDYLVYYSTSSISGMVNNTVVPITGLKPGLTQQNYPRIATDGVAMGIVWTQTVGGQVELPLLFTDNITNGFTTDYDTVDLGNITNADIAIASGTIHIVWEDASTGTVKYRSGQYIYQVGIEENNTTNALSVYPNPATSMINLQLANGFSGNVDLSISDITGRVVYNQLTPISNGIVSLDLSSYPAGTFLVEMRIEAEKFNTQFIRE